MGAERIFVGRKAELERFAEVLKDPKGQAVVVVGAAGMGKTWLVNEMMEAAYDKLDLDCGWVRYEVTPNETPDSTMARMMDNAFKAAQIKERSLDKTDRRLALWKALLNVAKIGDLVMSFRRDPARHTREQFVERLKLISKRMPESGRAIFIVDPEKYMCKDSDQDWAIVVRDLPDKVKFVFAQRPDDVLIESEVFKTLGNVRRIPQERLSELEQKAVDELVTLRVGWKGQKGKQVREALARYEGHPYALGAALDLIEAGVKGEELPKRPEPVRFAEEQWRQVCGRGGDAVRLVEAYAVLGRAVPEFVVEQASAVGRAELKSLAANSYLSSLFREEALGKRIYHAILGITY